MKTKTKANTKIGNCEKESEVTYTVVVDKVLVEGIEYTTYGIAMLKDGIIEKYAKDLSLDYDEINSLALLYTENNLSPIHFEDAIEDFLA